jgi:hypothetical protein
LINLSNWKLTLPVDASGKLQGKAAEVKQPMLSTYRSEWFYLNAAGDGYTFVAPTIGATTSSKTKNIRAEWRQMNGDKLAAWSSTVGRNTMTVELSVDVLPIGPKPHVVVAQIHDGNDDVTVFRVEGRTTERSRASIWITDGDSTRGFMLTDNYRIGDRIQVGFDVADGVIRYTFNGATVDYRQSKKVTGCYFKTGCYNQSGGIVTKLPDGRPDYAQVTIYACTVTSESATVPVITPGTPDDTAKQIAELQRQVTTLATSHGRLAVEMDRRFAALKAAL